jgi:hypothetical protein
LAFSQTNLNLIANTPMTVTVNATAQSASRGDTTVEVLNGANIVEASFIVTSIKHPTVNFRGRFEARFATQPAFYNQNAMYTAVSEAVGPGWTWGLEGEPDFVPTSGNVPENLDTTGMGRVVRLNNPVALRSHAAPVTSIVDSISGAVSGSTIPETFSTGDPLIGQPVDFGPDTYLAGNRNINPSDPTPEEFFSDGFQPMGLFELHFGTLFSGASVVSPFAAKATTINQKTRTTDSRPIAAGLADASAERTEIGLPSLQSFSETRIDLLVTDFNLSSAGTPERRNLGRRIGHLLSTVSLAKKNAVMAANPGEFTQRSGSAPFAWLNKEVYKGKVDTNLSFQPGGSVVVAYLSEFPSFNFEWHPFAFHTDELCAYHKGTLTHLNADGSYSGDPHTRTVNGKMYDFQAVGEFTLLRDGARMEIQVRQTPVATQNPVTDFNTGLTACVSVITAVAIRLGSHRVALQPDREPTRLQFYVDGKPADLLPDGIDLGGHRVTGFDANGETGLRVDSDDGTVVIATPLFWNGHNIWYMNVSVSNTRADEGLMGVVPKDSWLPRLRNGVTLDPMPASLQDRYVALYKKFADSWRVTDKTSLFVYEAGKSSKTFTDTDWPAEKPPCRLKSEFQVPGVKVFEGMPVEKARMVCKAVTVKDLHESCVFDVATTGDETFARGYVLAQELRLYGTHVRLDVGAAPIQEYGPAEKEDTRPQRSGQSFALTATVSPLTPERPTPTGTVTFFVDGVPMKRPINLDERGRARVMAPSLKPGERKIRATYSGGGKFDYHSSSSATLLHTVERK